MKLRPLLINGSLTLGSILFLLVLMEVFLRFLPVNEGFNFVEVDKDDPVFRAIPDQDVVSSLHWDFFAAQTLHVNNAGFRNDQDYGRDHGKPLIAVIGDSYVEAIQVPYAETFFGRLEKNLKPKAEVYSFGFSGAPLSQFLIWSQYAQQNFKNDYLAVNIAGGDFAESLSRYKQGPGFHHYAECGETGYCLELVEFSRSRLGAALKHSALARYLVYNLRVLSLSQSGEALWSSLFQAAAEPAYVGNVSVDADDQRRRDSELAVDLFLKNIPDLAGLPPERITFVFDGRLYEQPEGSFDQSYFGRMRHYFMTRARNLGFGVIDMRPVFSQHYKEHGARFESPRDGHWNALGHELVAAELERHFQAVLD
jgi:hypothetical protein